MLKRVILAAAGTGGHIFPALAIHQEIVDRYPETEVLFICSKRDVDRGWFESNIKIVTLPIRGVVGQGKRVIFSLFYLVLSFLKCFFVFLKFRPQVVVGFGGYGSFVPVFLATLFRIPSAIHEQNVYPGVANRILGRRVDKVFLSFEHQKRDGMFKNYIVSGNPVRKDILKIKPRSSFSKNLLVLGGSQGSKPINEAIVNILPDILSMGVNIKHQTGSDHFESVKQVYEKLGIKSDESVFHFIKDMASAYNWADLVICRAGAMTISELTAVGKPSILIPFPFAAFEHQLENAKYLQKNGAALVIEEKDLPKVNLAKIIESLFENPDKLQKMGERAKSLGKTDATQLIVDELERLVKTKGIEDGKS